MAIRGGAPVDIRVESPDLGRILRDMKAFEPKLATGLRREIRNAGKLAVTEMQSVVRSVPSKRDGGTRDALARGIAVRISAGKRSGVRIVSTGSKLPASKKPLVKAFNSSSFRHPVFGDTSHWVAQSGRPYFGSVIQQRKAEIAAAIERALNEAVNTLAHR